MSAPLPVPSSLEAFLTSVRCLPTSLSTDHLGGARIPGQIGLGELSDFAFRSMDMLNRTSPANLVNALDTLDGDQHALGVTVLLTVLWRHHSVFSDFDGLYHRTVIFITESNPDQIRFIVPCFAEMCHQFTEALIQRKCPMFGLLPLTKAIAKMQVYLAPSQQRVPTHTLTAIHSDLCKLSLESRCFSQALNIIGSNEFIDIPKETASCDVKYILLFFYYGGMILTAIKDFSRALFFFEVCVTIPANAVSQIMVEAYKKYLLVGLIHQGHKSKEAFSLPKYTSAVVAKYLKHLASPYNDIVSAFFCSKADGLKAAIATHEETLSNDENRGLVEQVLAAHTKKNIMRLTKTFLTLSIEEMALRVGIESSTEAEKLLIKMIEEGIIHARISQKDGMVRFDSSPSDRFNSVPVLQMIESRLQGSMELDKRVTLLDEEIVLNPNFIKKSHTSSSSSATTGSSVMPTDKHSEDDPSRVNNGIMVPRAGVASSTTSIQAKASAGNGSAPGLGML